MRDGYDLTGKVALITGGATGIGFGIAEQFIELGAKVVITGRSLDKLDYAKARLGVNCFVYQNDVTQKDDHEKLIGDIIENVGLIEV